MTSDVKTPDVKPATAKIYPFPVRTPSDAKHSTSPSPPTVRTVAGNCWYHDDAIQSEPKPFKPTR